MTPTFSRYFWNSSFLALGPCARETRGKIVTCALICAGVYLCASECFVCVSERVYVEVFIKVVYCGCERARMIIRRVCVQTRGWW